MKKGATTPEQVKKQEDNKKMRRQQELNDLRAVLSTQEGRRFFWRFLEKGKVFSATFTGNSTTFYNDGVREFAQVFFLDLMEIGLDVLATMQKEHKKDMEIWEGLDNA